jgi:hypothetical protein
MSTTVILLVGLFVTTLCAFGVWFTFAEMQRLSRDAKS